MHIKLNNVRLYKKQIWFSLFGQLFVHFFYSFFIMFKNVPVYLHTNCAIEKLHNYITLLIAAQYLPLHSILNCNNQKHDKIMTCNANHHHDN